MLIEWVNEKYSGGDSETKDRLKFCKFLICLFYVDDEKYTEGSVNLLEIIKKYESLFGKYINPLLIKDFNKK